MQQRQSRWKVLQPVCKNYTSAFNVTERSARQIVLLSQLYSSLGGAD